MGVGGAVNVSTLPPPATVASHRVYCYPPALGLLTAVAPGQAPGTRGCLFYPPLSSRARGPPRV